MGNTDAGVGGIDWQAAANADRPVPDGIVLDDAFAGAEPGPCPAWASNTFATLQSLHLTRGLRDGGVPPHAEVVADRTAEILRMPYPWLN
ncbi:hypothetical protein [Nocardia jiangxiensis]|uniref:Uncharacterized protein n=1 Tax=Nocardia jiangxiensis TaxID=282685 RepID=A0ABW6S0F4_9NOCA|nr:hypothetical protein [Nocardia jiangxiensis]